MPPLAALPLAASLAGGGAGCATDDDCSLLGRCSAGACACDAGWGGGDCARADLADYADAASGGEGGYVNASAASWGGRPLRVNGTWQLFVTEIAASCPLILFMNNSMVVRAESASGSAFGPYVHRAVVRPPFAHNPTAVGPTPEGYYLVYSIGGAAEGDAGPTPPEWLLNCSGGVLPSCAHADNCRSHGTPDGNGQIVLSYAKDPVAGPWSHRVVLPIGGAGASAWNCKHNNPSAVVDSTDGSVLLMYHGSTCDKSTKGERLGLATAAHWNDTTYTKRPGGPIIAPSNGTGSHEDPFLWIDKRGYFHAVTHNQGSGNVCGGGVAGHTCGAHLYSRDSLSWRVSKSAVYNATVRLASSKKAAALQTRQRPQLVFSDDGEVTPQWLFNGASFEGNNPDLNMLTHTMAFRFRSDADGGSGRQ